MKFSVIIPCYNNGRYLPECIESVLRNARGNDVEIICVDDCSTDGTGKLLDQYALKSDLIKVVRHVENKGTNESRRSGAHAASGDYILFIDPDDKLTDGIVDALESTIKRKNVDVLYFGFRCINQFGESKYDVETDKIRHLKKIQDGHLYASSKREVLDLTYTHSPKVGVVVWGRAWRRELLEKAFELIPEGWCVIQEDDCESLMFLSLAETVSMIDYIGYEYRIDSGVTSEELNEKSIIRYLRNAVFVSRFISAFKSHFGEVNPYSSYLRYIEICMINRYEMIASHLMKNCSDFDSLTKCFSSLDYQVLMLAMLFYNREKMWSSRFKVIQTFPFINLVAKIMRIWLKVRILLTKNTRTKNTLKSKRVVLKDIRARLKDFSASTVR